MGSPNAKAIAPGSFALRQRIALGAPWMLSILVGCAVLIALYVGLVGTWSVWGIALFVLMVALLGSTLVLYAGWHISLLKDGLVPTPKPPWQAVIAEHAILIETGNYSTAVPLRDIESISLAVDDSWDRLHGMESMCLLLRLKKGGRISIPRSTIGFDELLKALRTAD